MKFFLSILITCASLQGYGESLTDVFLKNIITDPAISFHCKELLKDKNRKIFIKQKIYSFLHRSKKLRKLAPDNKKSIKEKIKRTEIKLDQKLSSVNSQIRKMNEIIIRNGCPTISFEASL